MPRIRTKSAGFTLVEVLLISPIIVLFIAAFIALIVNLTGDGLRLQEKNTAAFEVQNALDTIEEDAGRSVTFPRETPTSAYFLESPQGVNNSATPFTVTYSNGTLIIAAAATTSNPLSATRQLVYTVPTATSCGVSNLTSYPYYQVANVYFIKDSALWRRVILGYYNTSTNKLCGTTWQKPSCQPGQSATPCQAEDARLIDNVTDFTVRFYTASGDASAIPSGNYTWPEQNPPSTIDVSITATKTISGETNSYTGTLRATSLNIE